MAMPTKDGTKTHLSALRKIGTVESVAEVIIDSACSMAETAVSFEQTLERTPVVGPVVKFMREVDGAELRVAERIIGKEVELAGKVAKAIWPKTHL
jgi:hypothetical protein